MQVGATVAGESNDNGSTDEGSGSWCGSGNGDSSGDRNDSDCGDGDGGSSAIPRFSEGVGVGPEITEKESEEYYQFLHL